MASSAHPLPLSPTELERFMREALVEADIAGQRGDFPIGAVVVIDGEIVSRGRAHRSQIRSKLAHAELQALMLGGDVLFTDHNRAVLLTTLEPCPLCLGAAVMSDVPHIVFGAYDKYVHTKQIVETNPYVRAHIITYLGGVLEDECRTMIERYMPRMVVSIDGGASPRFPGGIPENR